MTATFGKLQNSTLELSEGLNIIQAPNETGKSTWCAFLLSMLYGINSRERDRAGFIADKNRYAPWSGAAMSGRLDCSAAGSELTLTRSTRRQTAPLGDFQAVYTGTGDPVPALTAQTCGETLLGISREVFERSAFIRQAGLPITQDAGLERRIASLITSGEESISYSETAAALKKQLNRRRHNKTGQLPLLESELQEIRQQLETVKQLERRLREANLQTESLASQEQELSAELAYLDIWDSHLQQQDWAAAQKAAVQAEDRATALRKRIEEEHLPENDTIGRLRGAIVNLETVRKSVDKARTERDEAMKSLLRAEAALNESPFAGQSAESAKKEAVTPPKVRPSLWIPAAFAACTSAALAGLLSIIRSVGIIYLAGIGCAGLVLIALGTWSLTRRALHKAQKAALERRFGTADPESISALAESYINRLDIRDAAQADANAKSATADALYASLSSNEQGILLEVRRFAPAAFDIPTADAHLRSCAIRRKELQEAESAAREAAMQRDLLARQVPPAPSDADLSSPPPRGRETVTAQLEAVQNRLSTARSNADQLAGQLHAGGDPVVLRSAADHLAQQIQDLEGEYSAIQLAMEALDCANTALQNRFSPALGRHAAEIFRQLTEDRYSSVVLDRSFRLSAEPSGDSIYRDAGLLSAGAADQLYLAVRLAICDLVLPREKAVPLILDDALANFDDKRCAAALRFLKSAAKERQILLFSCHSREAAFFAGDSEVSIRQLTDAPELV